MANQNHAKESYAPFSNSDPMSGVTCCVTCEDTVTGLCDAMYWLALYLARVGFAAAGSQGGAGDMKTFICCAVHQTARLSKVSKTVHELALCFFGSVTSVQTRGCARSSQG